LYIRVPMKLVRLLKTCGNICISKYFSDNLPIQYGPKEVLSLLLFSFASEYAIRKVQQNHLLVYCDQVSLQEHNIDTIKNNTETLMLV
jgi:hypothetical protein